jgi:hypothetical protein
MRTYRETRRSWQSLFTILWRLLKSGGGKKLQCWLGMVKVKVNIRSKIGYVYKYTWMSWESFSKFLTYGIIWKFYIYELHVPAALSPERNTQYVLVLTKLRIKQRSRLHWADWVTGVRLGFKFNENRSMCCPHDTLRRKYSPVLLQE